MQPGQSSELQPASAHLSPKALMMVKGPGEGSAQFQSCILPVPHGSGNNPGSQATDLKVLRERKWLLGAQSLLSWTIPLSSRPAVKTI